MENSKSKDRMKLGWWEEVWGRVTCLGVKCEECDKMRLCPWAASIVERVLTWGVRQIWVVIQTPSLTNSASFSQLWKLSAHIFENFLSPQNIEVIK